MPFSTVSNPVTHPAVHQTRPMLSLDETLFARLVSSKMAAAGLAGLVHVGCPGEGPPNELDLSSLKRLDAFVRSFSDCSHK